MDDREKPREIDKEPGNRGVRDIGTYGLPSELAPMVEILKEIAADETELKGAYYGLLIGYIRESVTRWPVVLEKHLYKRMKKTGLCTSKQDFKERMEELEEEGLVETYMDSYGNILYKFTEKVEDCRKMAIKYMRKLLESPEFAHYLVD